MNYLEQCLADEEVFEVASNSNPRPELLLHVSGCPQCQIAVTRVKREIDDVRFLFDHEMNESLASVRPVEAMVVQASPPKATAQPLKSNRLQPGEKLGKYTVREYLGRGGMGEVYQILNPDLEIPLVAKICRVPNGLSSKKMIDCPREAMLREEARTLARLANSKRIARVYDLELSQHGPFIVMEMVPGRNLAQCFQEFSGKIEKIKKLMLDIAEGLGEAHRAGVVHGDLKPENILISQSGEVKLIDFGLARIRDAWKQGECDRVSGGTPSYMAPEQLADSAMEITPATDIFAAGLIFLELLTGARLSPSDTERRNQISAIMVGLDRADDRHPWKLACSSVIKRCLAIHPANRFASGSEFTEAIHSLVLEATQDHSRPNRMPWLILAAVVFVLCSWLVVNNPFASTSNSADLPIPGLLGTRAAEFGKLEQAIPLSLNELVSISTPCPKGLKWFVVWIDSERSVLIFSEQSESMSIKTEPYGDQGTRVIWPADGSVPLGGTGGTEMVLLIGVKHWSIEVEQNVHRAISDAVARKESWPDLPGDSLIRCSRDDVREFKADGTSKSIGPAIATPVSKVSDAIQKLRKSLRDQCVFLAGEAFLVSRQN